MSWSPRTGAHRTAAAWPTPIRAYGREPIQATPMPPVVDQRAAPRCRQRKSCGDTGATGGSRAVSLRRGGQTFLGVRPAVERFAAWYGIPVRDAAMDASRGKPSTQDDLPTSGANSRASGGRCGPGPRSALRSAAIYRGDVSTPKGGRFRVVDLPASVVGVLRDWLGTVEAEAAVRGVAPTWLFPGRDGSPLAYHVFRWVLSRAAGGVPRPARASPPAPPLLRQPGPGTERASADRLPAARPQVHPGDGRYLRLPSRWGRSAGGGGPGNGLVRGANPQPRRNSSCRARRRPRICACTNKEKFSQGKTRAGEVAVAASPRTAGPNGPASAGAGCHPTPEAVGVAAVVVSDAGPVSRMLKNSLFGRLRRKWPAIPWIQDVRRIRGAARLPPTRALGPRRHTRCRPTSARRRAI